MKLKYISKFIWSIWNFDAKKCNVNLLELDELIRKILVSDLQTASECSERAIESYLFSKINRVMWLVASQKFLCVFFDNSVSTTAPTSGFEVRDSDFWNQLIELYKRYYQICFPTKFKIPKFFREKYQSFEFWILALF